MTVTLKINARNDLHLPAQILRALNIGQDKIVRVTIKDNMLILMPVDLEPRYSKEALEGLDKLHEEEKKKKSWIRLDTDEDINQLLK